MSTEQNIPPSNPFVSATILATDSRSGDMYCNDMQDVPRLKDRAAADIDTLDRRYVSNRSFSSETMVATCADSSSSSYLSKTDCAEPLPNANVLEKDEKRIQFPSARKRARPPSDSITSPKKPKLPYLSSNEDDKCKKNISEDNDEEDDKTVTSTASRSSMKNSDDLFNTDHASKNICDSSATTFEASTSSPASSKDAINEKPDGSDDIYVNVSQDVPTMPTATTHEQLFHTKKAIVLTLGQSLLQFGVPCHRVEESMKHAAKMLKVQASFSIVPDLVLVSVTNPRLAEPETVAVKSPQAMDVWRVSRVVRTMNNFYKGHFGPEECLASLKRILASKPTCSNIAVCLSFALTGFTATACMFEGTWIDASAAGAAGLVAALLFIAANNFPAYGPVYEVSCSILVGFFARALNRYACFTKVAVSSILILLPGYGMTMSVMEITSRQVTTGAIRLTYATILAFMLAYGLQIGSRLYLTLDPEIADDGYCGPPVSPWFFILLVPVMSISIGLSYGSSRHQYTTQICCATVGFCVLYFLGKVVRDAQILSTIAAFSMGLYSNFACKLTGEPTLGPLCVGITLLVPGSIGVRSAFALLYQDDPTQALFALQMLQVALGLSVGLYAAGMIVYPMGKLQSLYISL